MGQTAKQMLTEWFCRAMEKAGRKKGNKKGRAGVYVYQIF